MKHPRLMPALVAALPFGSLMAGLLMISTPAEAQFSWFGGGRVQQEEETYNHQDDERFPHLRQERQRRQQQRQQRQQQIQQLPQQIQPQFQQQPTLGGTVGIQNAGVSNNFAHLAQIGMWRLLKTAWTHEDEMGYSNFVRSIGRSGCATVDSCMRGAGNPYRHTDPGPEYYTFWSDCADWPYFLRSYYAWKNGLPMVYSQSMSALPLTAEQEQSILEGKATAQTDVRYSWNGNRPNGRILLPNIARGTNFFAVHENIQNSVHTATYRVDPRTDFGDMYTPSIRLGSIRPGTAVYDPQGHVGVVYDITPDGQVMVFDALIDRKSISPRRPYGSDHYKRSKMEHGGWFQNFRPVVIEGARVDFWTNQITGGRARVLTNAEIADYSLEMFGTTLTADGRSAYVVGDKTTNMFQEFLRRRMFQGVYKINVVEEFKLRLKTICDDFKSRVSLVQDGTLHGISSRPHEPVLPNTIYGGAGDWDKYSTPGGDVRRRNSVNLAIEKARELKSLIDQRNPEYSYTGRNLKGDFIAAAQETLRACTITYNNSNNQPVRLNLDSLLQRMPNMSFSPWHCIELRWGATSQQELATCPDLRDQEKMRWYRAQQTMRNQMVRDTNIFTGFTLEQLEQKASELGPARPENFNLIQRLQQEL